MVSNLSSRPLTYYVSATPMANVQIGRGATGSIENNQLQAQHDQFQQLRHRQHAYRNNCFSIGLDFLATVLSNLFVDDSNQVARPTLAEVLKNQKKQLISPLVANKIEDMKTLIKISDPKNLMSLSVRKKNNKQTEFYMDLDEVEIEQIPQCIKDKFSEDDVTNGIHVILSNEALPPGGLEGKKTLIKSWLGLNGDFIDFHLHPKPDSSQPQPQQ
jgi:hypothetical protein